jgi:hypothetical protein
MMVSTIANRSGWGALAVVLGACGRDLPTSTSAATGIYVTSMTSGDPIEADGYMVSLDGGPGRSLRTNGVLVFSELEPGPHTLALSGMTSGCAVYGKNPRTVPLVSGKTAQSMFMVYCSVPGTGRILVKTFTYGIGPENYRVDLDIGRTERVDASGEVTFSAVPVGPVTVTLTGGAAEGCDIVGPNPRTLFLTERQEYFSVFKIHCPA